jgi:hypothetical protein
VFRIMDHSFRFRQSEDRTPPASVQGNGQYGSVRALDTLTRSDGNDERPIVSLRDTLFSSGRAFHLITNVWRSDAA